MPGLDREEDIMPGLSRNEYIARELSERLGYAQERITSLENTEDFKNFLKVQAESYERGRGRMPEHLRNAPFDENEAREWYARQNPAYGQALAVYQRHLDKYDVEVGGHIHRRALDLIEHPRPTSIEKQKASNLRDWGDGRSDADLKATAADRFDFHESFMRVAQSQAPIAPAPVVDVALDPVLAQADEAPVVPPVVPVDAPVVQVEQPLADSPLMESPEDAALYDVPAQPADAGEDAVGDADPEGDAGEADYASTSASFDYDNLTRATLFAAHGITPPTEFAPDQAVAEEPAEDVDGLEAGRQQFLQREQANYERQRAAIEARFDERLHEIEDRSHIEHPGLELPAFSDDEIAARNDTSTAVAEKFRGVALEKIRVAGGLAGEYYDALGDRHTAMLDLEEGYRAHIENARVAALHRGVSEPDAPADYPFASGPEDAALYDAPASEAPAPAPVVVDAAVDGGAPEGDADGNVAPAAPVVATPAVATALERKLAEEAVESLRLQVQDMQGALDEAYEIRNRARLEDHRVEDDEAHPRLAPSVSRAERGVRNAHKNLADVERQFAEAQEYSRQIGPSDSPWQKRGQSLINLFRHGRFEPNEVLQREEAAAAQAQQVVRQQAADAEAARLRALDARLEEEIANHLGLGSNHRGTDLAVLTAQRETLGMDFDEETTRRVFNPRVLTRNSFDYEAQMDTTGMTPEQIVRERAVQHVAHEFDVAFQGRLDEFDAPAAIHLRDYTIAIARGAVMEYERNVALGKPNPLGVAPVHVPGMLAHPLPGYDGPSGIRHSDNEDLPDPLDEDAPAVDGAPEPAPAPAAPVDALADDGAEDGLVDLVNGDDIAGDADADGDVAPGAADVAAPAIAPAPAPAPNAFVSWFRSVVSTVRSWFSSAPAQVPAPAVDPMAAMVINDVPADPEPGQVLDEAQQAQYDDQWGAAPAAAPVDRLPAEDPDDVEEDPRSER